MEPKVHSDPSSTPENPAKTCQVLQKIQQNDQSETALRDLTRPQTRAIEALLVAKSVTDAARKSRIGLRTLYRWMHQDRAFQRGLSEARREVVVLAMHRLQNSSLDAANNLAKMIFSPDGATVGRVAAARTILDYAFRFAKIQEQDQ